MSRAKLRIVELESDADGVLGLVATMLGAVPEEVDEEPPEVDDEERDEDEEPETCGCDESLWLRGKLEEAEGDAANLRKVGAEVREHDFAEIERLRGEVRVRDERIVDLTTGDTELRLAIEKAAPITSKAWTGLHLSQKAARVIEQLRSRMPAQERAAENDVAAMKAHRDATWLDEIQVLVFGDVSPSRNPVEGVRAELERLRTRLLDAAKKEVFHPTSDTVNAMAAENRAALAAKAEELSAAMRANADLVRQLEEAKTLPALHVAVDPIGSARLVGGEGLDEKQKRELGWALRSLASDLIGGS